MRRKWLIALVAGVLVMLLAFTLIRSERRVTIGMDKSDVEEILGPHGLEIKFAEPKDLPGFAESLEMPAPPPGAVMMRWDRRHSSVHVLFDPDRKVVGVYYPRRGGFNVLLRSIGLD
jgi:hypothetical protein